MAIEEIMIEIFYTIAVLCVIKPFIVIAAYMIAARKAMRHNGATNIENNIETKTTV